MTTATVETMAHRKQSPSTSNNNTLSNTDKILQRVTYGVPSGRRLLSATTLRKKHDRIRDYLIAIGLTTAQREATFYLLRLYAYYGKVYPKAPNWTNDFYASKRSFWRAIAKLEESGLIERINRYLNHLQISNCYRLDKLVLCIIKYLAEHGCPFLPKLAHELLNETGVSFWRTIRTLRVRLRDPIPLTFEA